MDRLPDGRANPGAVLRDSIQADASVFTSQNSFQVNDDIYHADIVAQYAARYHCLFTRSCCAR